MGQATILEHLGEGLYRVRLEYDTTLLEQRIASANQRRQQLLAARSEASAQEVDARIAQDNARATLNGLISQFEAGQAEQQAVTAATADALRASATYQAALFKCQSLDAQLLSLSLDVAAMEAVRTLPEPEVQAWCADLTVDLAGLVGVIDPAGEPLGESPGGAPPLLHPGWEGAGEWRCARDGMYQRQQANAVFASLVDGMQLAAWQMHRPRHRLAQIVAIDRAADTCSIVIDSVTSSVQSLPIDPPDPVLLTQADVPVLYMDCNSAAFAEGARVVVAFSGDWTTPTVIGFEDHPQPCALSGFLALPTAAGVGLNGWGEPVTEDNAPLGSPGGSGLDPWNHRYTVVTPEGEYLRRGMPGYDAAFPVEPFSHRPVAGNCDWYGEALGGGALTWDKGAHRYFEARTEWRDPITDQSAWDFLLGQRVAKSMSPTGEALFVTAVAEVGDQIQIDTSTPLDGRQLFFNGRDLNDAAGGGIGIVSRVSGAGAVEHSYEQDGETVTDTWLIWVEITGLNGAANQVLQETVYAQQVTVDADGDISIVAPRTQLGQLDYRPNPTGNLCASDNETCWAFSQSGRQAAAIRSHCDVGDNSGVLELYQLAFVVDETGVLMGTPAIESAGSGTETWSTVDGEHFQHSIDASLEVLVAVDYRDNQLQRATVTQEFSSRVDISIVPLIGTDTVNSGTRIETHTNTLHYAGKSLVLSTGTVTSASSYTPPAGDWPTPPAYETTLERVTDITSRALLWLDLRHDGYVAYSEVADTSTRVEVFSGAQIEGGPQYSWAGAETDTVALAYHEHFDGVGQVWADSLEFPLTVETGGSNDPLSDTEPKNITGIEVADLLIFYPESGTRSYLRAPHETNGLRPNPVILGNNGALVAISNASGFNTAPWSIDKRRSFYHYPATLLGDSGLDGKTCARVCPLVRV